MPSFFPQSSIRFIDIFQIIRSGVHIAVNQMKTPHGLPFHEHRYTTEDVSLLELLLEVNTVCTLFYELRESLVVEDDFQLSSQSTMTQPHHEMLHILNQQETYFLNHLNDAVLGPVLLSCLAHYACSTFDLSTIRRDLDALLSQPYYEDHFSPDASDKEEEDIMPAINQGERRSGLLSATGVLISKLHQALDISARYWVRAQVKLCADIRSDKGEHRWCRPDLPWLHRRDWHESYPPCRPHNRSFCYLAGADSLHVTHALLLELRTVHQLRITQTSSDRQAFIIKFPHEERKIATPTVHAVRRRRLEHNESSTVVHSKSLMSGPASTDPLPLEILQHIIVFLSPRWMLVVGHVCRRWARLFAPHMAGDGLLSSLHLSRAASVALTKAYVHFFQNAWGEQLLPISSMTTTQRFKVCFSQTIMLRVQRHWDIASSLDNHAEVVQHIMKLNRGAVSAAVADCLSDVSRRWRSIPWFEDEQAPTIPVEFFLVYVLTSSPDHAAKYDVQMLLEALSHELKWRCFDPSVWDGLIGAEYLSMKATWASLRVHALARQYRRLAGHYTVERRRLSVDVFRYLCLHWVSISPLLSLMGPTPPTL